MTRVNERGATTSLRAIDREAFGFDEARHLLSRAGFGGTPEQVRLLADWGPEKAVDHLLNFGDVPFEEAKADRFDGAIMREPTAEERAVQRRAAQARDEDTLAKIRAAWQEREATDRRQMQTMQRWWLERMIETPRPLEEKMTLFWHGHFATSYRTIENSYHMYMQNRLFRSHAAGNFGELLARMIRDPAMLAYLDNHRSRRESPNENLARELMELFSLGVGNYGEEDIKEGARALTGYSFANNEFVFRKEWHDPGSKAILGKRGALDGDDFVQAILAKRQCAEFICAKLHRQFVSEGGAGGADRASAGVIDDLAATMRSSRYEVKPVLKRLFLSEHFYDPANRNCRIKSPVELVVGAVRMLGAPVRDLGVLCDAMELMGQDLFFPPSVAGWAGGRTWINTSTLFVRQNITTFLLAGKTPTGFHALAQAEKYDPTALLGPLKAADPGAERDPERVCEYLLRVTLGAPVGGGTWAGSDRLLTLTEFARANGGEVTPDLLVGALSIITAMPEHQLC